ncbi:hypothetical protein CSC35_1689 [Enterobacter hormaechei]|nr:hypothetical protein CSC35_1689 [Enterobacter hormaechei]
MCGTINVPAEIIHRIELIAFFGFYILCFTLSMLFDFVVLFFYSDMSYCGCSLD